MTSPRTRLREWEIATRPEHPDLARALADRWESLPAHVKQPNQMLGKRMSGCEGTHGVFPRCNLACTPCYHAKEANRVRVDGDHTESEVDAQMALLRRLRGPGQHAQLIGGEVTLLGAEDHARALRAMIRHGRKPMSMTHGDFDYDYLVALAIDPATGAAALRPPRLRRALRLDDVRPAGDQARRRRGRAQPVPRALLRAVPAPGARARRDALPRAQHHGHAAQPRRDPAARARLPRDGFSHVLLPAGGVHR